MIREDGLILETTGRPRDRHIIGYENPFEYFLYGVQNTEIRLSFTDAGLANLRQQYVPNPNFSPEIWRSHPEYVATTALWQDWAGKWVNITGSYNDNQVFQVTSLTVATPPAIQFATYPTNRRGELVEMIALVGDFPVLPESIYPYTFLILDVLRDDGMPFKMMVYTENYSSWTKSAIPFSLFRTWVKLKGWHFNPSRYTKLPDLIEVQSIEKTVSPPQTTITFVPFVPIPTSPPLVPVPTTN